MSTTPEEKFEPVCESCGAHPAVSTITETSWEGEEYDVCASCIPTGVPGLRATAIDGRRR